VSGIRDVRPRGAAVPRRHQYRELQALEDAIAYRRARVAADCPDCGSLAGGIRCDEHSCDLALIAGYQEAARAVIVALSRPVPGIRGNPGSAPASDGT
jgi:hypothetical protein